MNEFDISKGDAVRFKGDNFLVDAIYSRDWIKATMSPEYFNDKTKFGMLLRAADGYYWSAYIFEGNTYKLNYIGTKYCPPQQATQAQLAAFKERMAKAKLKKEEENEQVKKDKEEWDEEKRKLEESNKLRHARTTGSKTSSGRVKKGSKAVDTLGLPRKKAKGRKR